MLQAVRCLSSGAARRKTDHSYSIEAWLRWVRCVQGSRFARVNAPFEQARKGEVLQRAPLPLMDPALALPRGSGYLLDKRHGPRLLEVAIA